MLKEPEIKLFGRKISLPEHSGGGGGSSESSGGCDRCFEERREDGREEKQEQIDEELAEGEVCDTTSREDDDRNPSHKTNTTESGSDDSTKNSPTDGDVESGRRGKSDTNPNEKTTELKKPDKILACPRCSSMDTKFCYYNNYNVNQPRHFCKSCQRYWTAGGTMRNVPVGAGRRKNKSSAPHCRHITISEHPPAAATVLSFAPDKLPAAAATSRTGPPPNPSGQNGFPCVPWPYPWSSAVPVPAIFPPPPGYPVPCYLWNSGGWSMPWVSPAASEAAASSPTSTLGKHPRSGELPTAEGGEGRRSKRSSIVVPKTLRIDDPEEAARSSIWSTLGINYDSVGREGLFKALQPKGDVKKQPVAADATAAAASSFMQANPAALSRSLKFQEAV